MVEPLHLAWCSIWRSGLECASIQRCSCGQVGGLSSALKSQMLFVNWRSVRDIYQPARRSVVVNWSHEGKHLLGDRSFDKDRRSITGTVECVKLCVTALCINRLESRSQPDRVLPQALRELSASSPRVFMQDCGSDQDDSLTLSLGDGNGRRSGSRLRNVWNPDTSDREPWPVSS